MTNHINKKTQESKSTHNSERKKQNYEGLRKEEGKDTRASLLGGELVDEDDDPKHMHNLRGNEEVFVIPHPKPQCKQSTESKQGSKKDLDFH